LPFGSTSLIALERRNLRLQLGHGVALHLRDTEAIARAGPRRRVTPDDGRVRFHYIGFMPSRLDLDLDDQLAARLEAAAARERKTMETFAADAVARAVHDAETWADDEAAYAEYQRTGEAIPLAAMEDWVKTWGSPDERQPPDPCKSSS
jgi:predicted transcriptional regulator